MIKATCGRKNLLGSYSLGGLLGSMMIMAGNLVAGRHGAGTVAESSHLIQKMEADRE